MLKRVKIGIGIVLLGTMVMSTSISCAQERQIKPARSCYDSKIAIQHAQKYLNLKVPSYLKVVKPTPIAHDLGSEWVIYFKPPTGTVGGDATVNVQKSPCQVIGAILGQ